jgi:hypothetical protein
MLAAMGIRGIFIGTLPSVRFKQYPTFIIQSPKNKVPKTTTYIPELQSLPKQISKHPSAGNFSPDRETSARHHEVTM